MLLSVLPSWWRSGKNLSRKRTQGYVIRSPGFRGPSAAGVAAICAAEILGLAGYSIVPALLPQVMDSWSLSSTQGGWLAGTMFAGYMLGVVPLVALTDVVPARTVYLASAALSILSTFGVAFSDALLPVLGFRALAGIALAGMYMPGLRALTDDIEGPRRARIAGFYSSSFTVGASLSFLLGRAGTLWGWRTAFIVAALAGLAGLLIASALLPRSSSKPSPKRVAVFPFRAVFENRDAAILIAAYAATIWGAVGLRQWIVLFLGFCAGDPMRADWSMLAIAATINLLGVPAGLLGNELAIRFGLRITASLVFLVSAIVTGLFGLAATLPFIAAAVTSLAVSLIAQGNFSNLTSGLLAVAAPRYAGATMAVYSCIGFGGGFVGTVVFGIVLDEFGGATRLVPWIMSFGTCGLACLAGAAATVFLSRTVMQTV
jgi:predicted MFS family arabinose efflux permease